ncbi:hypothetical protein EAI_12534 [Harpegnathos saltator]|uniref:Uncharacterized protein n=1 Tax=Harpegnathos saltator TaxID=610380 RepID=E2B6J0_HARSA|nr:hypothetical protein EAI_12534 [Harpegnathos saltator]
MSSLPGNFVDRIDPFAKRSLKKKSKKSQGSSRYRNSQDVELQQLPQLKGTDEGNANIPGIIAGSTSTDSISTPADVNVTIIADEEIDDVLRSLVPHAERLKKSHFEGALGERGTIMRGGLADDHVGCRQLLFRQHSGR